MYSKISNKLFHNKDSVGIIKQINNHKTLLVFDYLYLSTTRHGIINFTLEDIIIECGFKPKTGTNKNNEQFANIISCLCDLDIIKFIGNVDTNNIKFKTMYKCCISVDLNSNYTELHDYEKDKIIAYNKKRIDNVKLLVLYCYLKSRMYKRLDSDDINKTGGKAECCYPTYDRIHKDIGLSQSVVKKYIDILKELKLIDYKNAGRWYYKKDKNKSTKDSANTYVLYDVNSEDELNEGIRQYKKQYKDRVFVDGDYKDNDRKINGSKGGLTRLVNGGIAKQEHLDKLDRIKEIEATKNGNNDIVFNVQRLLHENSDMLLSEIYDDIGERELYEKYIDLEVKLGLVEYNSEDDIDLLVDWDYYKWIMCNYVEDKFKYYKNCVNKWKRDKAEKHKNSDSRGNGKNDVNSVNGEGFKDKVFEASDYESWLFG